jgi:hypothetical protein
MDFKSVIDSESSGKESDYNQLQLKKELLICSLYLHTDVNLAILNLMKLKFSKQGKHSTEYDNINYGTSRTRISLTDNQPFFS